MSKATWIWKFSDLEVRWRLVVDCRRLERNFYRPAPWALDDCAHNVRFYKKYNLERPERAKIAFDGFGSVVIDSRYVSCDGEIYLPAGEHEIVVEVANLESLPALFIEGEHFVTDKSWFTASTTHEAGNFFLKPVGYWNFDSIDTPPSSFTLERRPIGLTPLRTERGVIYDAGKETFAALTLCFLGEGSARIYYGESREEALSDSPYIWVSVKAASRVEQPARAFRYIRVECDAGVSLDGIFAEYEYLPTDWRASFRCSDDLINGIYEVSRYTLELNSREFYLDGIKRDRYLWSGDAYQSYLLNYYSSFDCDICKRTTLALGGNSTPSRHINTIADYTFYWILGISDYFKYTADVEFVRNVYPRMIEWIEMCLARTDSDGFIVGMLGDWIFIDWLDTLEKSGPVSAEQMLLSASLGTVIELGSLLSYDVSGYERIKAELDSRIEWFWDEELGAYVDSFKSGKRTVNRHANIFAIRFGFADEVRARRIAESVIDNGSVKAIKTPYFKFYELESLCSLGRQDKVTQHIRDYWGGMLKLGATSFWEEYDPTLADGEHYAMYGDPFGKSLCHAWGASPLYLLGRFYLGVYPTSYGYKSFRVEPNLGGLDYIEGSVPTPNGDIRVYMDKSRIKVTSDICGGTLVVNGVEYSIPVSREFEIKI